MPSPSLVTSGLLHHVPSLPLTHLIMPRPSHDQDLHRNGQNTACPVAPRHAHALARAHMAQTLDAPERDDPRALASPRPSLSAPVDARRHPAAPGHGHLPAGTPQSTTTTTITRRGAERSHQAHHLYRASSAPRSCASSSPVHQEPDAPMPCLFATLERRRRRRP